MKIKKYRKYSKYSIENPKLWAVVQEEDAPKDVDFLMKLFKKYGKVKRVLDVGCGTGAHSYLLTRGGYTCYGVDANPAMIEYAKKKYNNISFDSQFMQNLNVTGKFDAVLLLGNIIAFNKSNEEVLKTFRNCYKQLTNNGILILTTANPIAKIAAKTFMDTIVDTGKDMKLMGIKGIYKESINENKQTQISDRTYYSLKTGKIVGRYSKESRLYFPQEIKFFLEQAGFKFVDFYGGNYTGELTLNSKKLKKRYMLVVAKK